jgi:putative copper resistance protein D
MDLVMRNAWAGQVEHLVYLAVGVQFFVVIVGDEPVRWRLSTPARWLLLAVAMAVDTFTGIVLLQGSSPVGMVMDRAVAVDALSDTRTGGAIMWVGGDAIMAFVMIALVIEWLRCADLGQQRSSWLEQARAATLAQHTAAVGDSARGADAPLDEDEAARASYNAWLASLNRDR